MKRKHLFTVAAVLFAGSAFCALSGHTSPVSAQAPNGIELPSGYKDWRLISTSHRTDNNTIRVILGNDTAVRAARAGKTNPWPDGAVLAKLVWKDASHPEWQEATVAGNFVHAEFMMKDSVKYAETYGWGFSRWLGLEQKPFGADKNFTQSCINCHEPVKENDWVFTRPAQLP